MISENIKKYRKEKKLTQKQLAVLCDISTSYVQQLELGQKENPSIEILTKIATALETSVESLLTPDDQVNFSNIPKSERGPIEDFFFDNPDTFDIINFLESHGYNIEYDSENITIISRVNGDKIGPIPVNDFTDFDNTLKKLLDYTKSIADKFVDNISEQYKK